LIEAKGKFLGPTQSELRQVVVLFYSFYITSALSYRWEPSKASLVSTLLKKIHQGVNAYSKEKHAILLPWLKMTMQ